MQCVFSILGGNGYAVSEFIPLFAPVWGVLFLFG